MRTRPQDYHDWRSEWHHTAKLLGWHIDHNIHMGKPVMDRDTWRYHHRMRRIKARLEAERGAKTDSFCVALLECLTGTSK